MLLTEHDPDFVLITETWLNKDSNTAMLNIEGYYIEPDLRMDRRDTMNGIGGGLIVYIKNGLIVKPLPVENNFNQFVQFEVVNNDDSCAARSLNITLIYRPPSSRDENTDELCKLFDKASKNSIFIGDFNFPGINWEYETSDRKGANFLQCTKDNYFEQLIDFKTHIRGNTLDLLFSNQPDKIINIEPLGNLGNSDHSIIMCELEYNSRFNDSTEKIWNWKNAEYDRLADFLHDVDWEHELTGTPTDEAWTFLKDKILTGMDNFVPKIPRRTKNSPRWMTSIVKRLVRRKQRLYNIFMETRRQEDEISFKKLQKECKKAVRQAKRKFEQKIAVNGNKRPFVAYIKSKTKSRAGVGPLKVGNRTISDDKDMATELNKAFCSVFTKEVNQNHPTCQIFQDSSIISDIYFTENMVREKINKLKSTSAPGPDKIPARFLKEYVDLISYPLSILFDSSMRSGIVPQDWRLANVTPIFKKGSKSKPENYRPVSLTSICCKIMESIIRDQLVNHLKLNNLIKRSQHGFMKNKSCTTNLLEFLDRVTTLIDQGDSVDVIYLDFSKAFDKVPKNRLLDKIKAHNIRGNVHKWISEWLSGRLQRTVLNGSFSEWCEVLSGVPQGSVLGPLAFIIFINDLDGETSLISIMNKFADDTKLGHKANIEADKEVLQKALDDLCVWSDRWGMEFNVNKCKVLHLGKKNNEFEYYMNGSLLASVDQERDIGVIVEKSLKPSLQCAEAAKKAMVVLGQITRAFQYRDRYIFLKLYVQFVRCHLEFASPVWSPWHLGDIETLEKVQRRAVNYITGLKGATYEDKLKELGILSLASRRSRADLIQVFKILKGIDDVDSTTWFTLVGQEPQRLTRNTAYHGNLVATRSKIDIRSNFFTNRVVAKWNGLPIEVKDSRTLTIFKSKLDGLLN